jgi:hypothetical protein
VRTEKGRVADPVVRGTEKRIEEKMKKLAAIVALLMLASLTGSGIVFGAQKAAPRKAAPPTAAPQSAVPKGDRYMLPVPDHQIWEGTEEPMILIRKTTDTDVFLILGEESAFFKVQLADGKVGFLGRRFARRFLPAAEALALKKQIKAREESALKEKADSEKAEAAEKARIEGLGLLSVPKLLSEMFKYSKIAWTLESIGGKVEGNEPLWSQAERALLEAQSTALGNLSEGIRYVGESQNRILRQPPVRGTTLDGKLCLIAEFTMPTTIDTKRFAIPGRASRVMTSAIFPALPKLREALRGETVGFVGIAVTYGTRDIDREPESRSEGEGLALVAAAEDLDLFIDAKITKNEFLKRAQIYQAAREGAGPDIKKIVLRIQ